MTQNTIIFDHYNHIRLWDWLVNNPDKEKEKWPEWGKNGGCVDYVCYSCFACRYAISSICHFNGNFFSRCEYCPFGYFHGKTCLDGLFEHWDNELDLNKKFKLAKQIRDYPIRTDMEVLTNYIKY